MKCIKCKQKITEIETNDGHIMALKLSFFKGIHITCLGDELWRWLIKNKVKDEIREWRRFEE